MVFGSRIAARAAPGADRRGAVAPFRLEQDRRLGADLRQLLGDAKAIITSPRNSLRG
jgi:hypothetical protein